MAHFQKMFPLLLGIALLTWAACGGGSSSNTTPASTECSNIAGTWYWYRLQSGSSSNWARGTQSLAADCTVEVLSFLDSSGGTSLTSTSETWSLDADGILTRSDVPTMRGMLIPGNKVMVYTRTAGDGVSVRLAIAIKAGSGFVQTDLEGTHNIHMLRTGASPLWAYGTVTHDAAGSATSFWNYSTGANGAGVASVQTLNTDGAITDSLNNTWEGHLDTGKEFMAATATMPDGSFDLFVGTGAATGFTAADLEGTWRWHRLQTGAGSHWARGRLSVDATGVVTQLSYSDSDGGNTPSESYTLSIDDAGAVTRADNATYHGQMSASKTVITAVQSNAAGDAYRLIISRKE